MLFPLVLFTVLLASCSGKDHYDLDGDNVVGIDEFAVVSFAEHGLSKGEIGEIVKEADGNSNGVLERGELAKAKGSLEKIANERGAQWLKDNDSNRDGRLSRKEFMSAVGKKVALGYKDTSDMWRMSDRDQDGFLSYSEAASALYLIRTKAILVSNKMLEKFDSDKNGRLSEDEAILMADIAYDVGTEDALDAFERVARNEVDIGSSLMEGLLETLRESALANVSERIREVDTDGDGVVSFNELRKRYRKKKPTLLKKLFRKVDVNRDSSLDGPEWVTLVTEISMLKKRKPKHDRVIHVHPSTTGEYTGAARDDDDDETSRRRKRDTPTVDEEVVQMEQWDGLIVPVHNTEHSTDPVKEEKIDNEFVDFQSLTVANDE